MGGVTSQGTKFGVSVLPASTYTQVDCTTAIDKQDVESATIDTTCLTDTAKTKILGLQDNGSLVLTMNVNFEDVGYQIVTAAKASGDEIGFQYEQKPQAGFTTGRIFTGTGFVKSAPYNFAVDTAVTGSITFEINGEIVETAPVV